MKIVMLCDFYNENLEYQENLLAKYYTKNGHEVTIIASTFESIFDYYAGKYNSKVNSKEYDLDSIKIIKQPYAFNFFNKIKKLKNVDNILNQVKPNLIFAHDIHLNLFEAVSYVKKNSDCKIIMDYHADYMNSAKNWLSLNLLHKIIRKQILYKVKPHIKKIFPVVPTSAKFLNEVYGISYNEMELLILGSDTDTINNIRLTGEYLNIRNKYNIPKDAIVIVSGGKLTPFKKTELLIEAFFKISNPNLYLLIIGDTGAENIEYKKYLLDSTKNNDKIYFTGWLNTQEVYAHMLASDIAVFPKSQSVLWQQAISCGLPLIVGLVGGNDVSYLNKYNCIIELEEYEITSMTIASRIKTLLDDKQLLTNMHNNSRKTADELLNYNKIILQTLV